MAPEQQCYHEWDHMAIMEMACTIAGAVPDLLNEWEQGGAFSIKMQDTYMRVLEEAILEHTSGTVSMLFSIWIITGMLIVIVPSLEMKIWMEVFLETKTIKIFEIDQ